MGLFNLIVIEKKPLIVFCRENDKLISKSKAQADVCFFYYVD